MQRIYLPHTQFSEELVLTDLGIHHQLTRVMRARIWDRVLFFDGVSQKDYIYEITSIDKKTVWFQMIEEIENNSESNVNIHVFQALPNKLSKLEYIIQKCAEIGVQSITFFPAERSQKIVLSEAKKERLSSIMKEAIELSGRSMLMNIHYIDSLPQGEEEGKHLVFHTKNNASQSLQEIADKKGKTYCIYVWPEGGFSEIEIQHFGSFCSSVYLWERILRTETAGVVTSFFLIQSC